MIKSVTKKSKVDIKTIEIAKTIGIEIKVLKILK